MFRHIPTAKQPLFAIAFFLGFTIPPTFADPVASGAIPTEALPTVVVTATRTARTVDETLSSVTVLDKKDIIQSGAFTVPDLLQNVSGVDFSRSGGPGELTGMSLRGTNSNHVLLLMDGIPVSATTTGAPSWEYLPLVAVDRIEVVRGPGSSLYGSSAIGGIVQIFTPRGEGPPKPEISVRFGSLATYQVNAGVTGGENGTHYSLGVGQLYTAGIDPMDASLPHIPYGGGYRNSSLQVHLGQQFDHGEVNLHLLRAEGRSGYDNYPNYNPPTFTPTPSPPTSETFLQQVVGADLTLSPRTFWKTKLTLGESRDDRNDVPDVGTPYYFHTRREYSAWQNDLTLSPDNLLTLGVDHEDDHVGSDTNFTLNSRGNTGVFLQDQATFGRQDVVVGVRHDDNDAFGEHSTGNINYGLRLTSRLRFIAAWGSAFRAPTFDELYYPGFSNPKLHPETSHTADVGLKGIADWGKWEIHAFRTDIGNLIASNAPLYIPFNLERARIDGAEISANTRVAGWDLSGAFTLLDPRNRDTGAILPRRSRHTLQLGAARQFGAMRAQLTVLDQGGRYDDTANTTRLSGYTLVGIGVNYALDRRWSLEGRVDNLLNTHYETAAPYQSPGCTVMVGIRYAPR